MIAVVNASTIPPLLSGNAGFLLSLFLAVGALAALPAFARGIRARRTALTAGWVLIILFLASQIGGRFDFGRERPKQGLDFSAYYLAGKALREPAKPLYYVPTYPDGRMNFVTNAEGQTYWYRMAMREGITETMQFNYPPLAGMLFEPFTFLPYPVAFGIWTGATVLLFLGAIVLLVLLTGSENRLAVLVGAVIGVFSLSPVRTSLYFGQINALLLFLWTLGVYLYKKERSGWSALCFALGAMIKITPAMVMPLFLLRRKWRWLAMYAGWIAVCFVVSAAGAGWGNMHAYVSQVLPSMSCGAPSFYNRSAAALVQFCYLRWVPLTPEMPATLPPSACTVAKAVSALVYLTMLAVLYRGARKRDMTDALVWMALVTLLVSPVTWPHHYTLAVLPLLYLWLCKLGASGLRFLSVIVFTTLLIGTDVALYGVILVRHAAIDLALAALPPATLALLVVLNSRSETEVPSPTAT